ncbi:MAG: WD repeat-containing protein jip5 [Chrysothrix sp. TS-e1954]|nr:MAG: WD repeat-containing protein jip5 [Chrysothrix sp. TS-e1954]
MFDNICTLPLSSDLLTLALHPREPLFAVGLSSGHVETFRLPSASNASSSTSETQVNGKRKPQRIPRRTSNSSLSPSAPPPRNVTSVWRTHRHKGSCRALAFSTDGSTLFSAGTDGVLKAARSADGRVVGKTLLENEGKRGLDNPSTLCTLSPELLVLGTDRGAVQLYELSSKDGNLVPSSKASKKLYPHRTKDDPKNEESVASLCALPPSATSTSGTPRAFLSTAGATLAVIDVHKKAVVAVSESQREDLVGIACLPSREKDEKDIVLVGTDDGKLALWNRGAWHDNVGSITVHTHSIAGTIIPFNNERDVESVALCPPHSQQQGTVCAVGLGNGMIKFVQIPPLVAKVKGRKGAVLSTVSHNERGIDGVTAMGFDVGGRLVSGGGNEVRVWHRQDGNKGEPEKRPRVNWDKTGKLDDNDRILSNGKGPKGAVPDGDISSHRRRDADDTSDESSGDPRESSSSPDTEFRNEIKVPGLPPRKKRRKGKNAEKNDGRNSHGILQFSGL